MIQVVAVCDECWYDEHNDMPPLSRLGSSKTICGWCKEATQSGIYICEEVNEIIEVE